MKFDFILAEKANYPVVALCRNLGVSRQGYYAYLKRPPSKRAQRDQELRAAIVRIFEASRRTYGSPRVFEALRTEGIRTSKRRVERLMRELGLQARERKRYRVTTIADESHPVANNTLERDFRADAPDQRWVTDITYVWTAEGWVYLAAIVDLHSRFVVGWAISAVNDRHLVLRALEQAVEGDTRPLQRLRIPRGPGGRVETGGDGGLGALG